VFLTVRLRARDAFVRRFRQVLLVGTRFGLAHELHPAVTEKVV
jgi:hypothetical protein